MRPRMAIAEVMIAALALGCRPIEALCSQLFSAELMPKPATL